MEIVIKISDQHYKRIMKAENSGYDLIDAIQNGTVLPKGHGDLIDRDELSPKIHGVKSIVAVSDAPAIVEADKETQDETNC